jgi:hypothetical protein
MLVVVEVNPEDGGNGRLVIKSVVVLLKYEKSNETLFFKNLESKLSKTTSSLQSTYRLLNQKITTIENLRKHTQTRQYLEYIISIPLKSLLNIKN